MSRDAYSAAFVVDRPDDAWSRLHTTVLPEADEPCCDECEHTGTFFEAVREATLHERSRLLAIAARLFPACDVDTLRAEVDR